MNRWTQKSIYLASSYGYLDKLSKVYPINSSVVRDISSAEKAKINTALKRGNAKELILGLLKLERFPIDDPYIGFFRRYKGAMDKNPKTVARIGKKLFKMGYKEILKGASKEKSASRQFGQMFRNYLPKLGFPILDEQEFLKHKGKAILAGGDAALKNFAKNHLHYRGQKGLDLIFKTGKIFVIGETKFITTGGGTQDKSFREAIAFVKKRSRPTVHIAILDGVLWILNDNKKRSLYSSITRLKKNQIALSSLLLKDFIRSL